MTEDKFWSRVDRSGGPSACWPWMGAKERKGYGHISCTAGQVRAHRAAWALVSPDPPLTKDVHVLHRCDNPPCCNPAHLWTGTNQDNVNDCKGKGRNTRSFGDASGARKHPELLPRGPTHGFFLHPERIPVGVRNGHAKLTDADVIEIVTAYRPGLAGRMAEKYGVARGTVTKIMTGRTWTHLTGKEKRK